MSRDELRALADAADAAADAITAINTRDGNGRDMPWSSKDLTDYAYHLRVEADEIDDDPWDDTQCIHCGAWDGQPHDRTCREGADE